MWWLMLAAGCGGGQDVDGDGVTVAQGDCDDLDPTINPTVSEHCDGVDEDCDGTVDNDAVDVITYYVDADGDGFGDPDQPVDACERGDLEGSNTDCDDSDPKINPDASDTDTKDRNCDGRVGEDAAGDWTGGCDTVQTSFYSIATDITLTLKDKDGAITGTGDVAIYDAIGGGLLIEGDGPVTGTRDFDQLSMVLSAPEFGSLSLIGTLHGDTMDLDSILTADTVCTLTR